MATIIKVSNNKIRKQNNIVFGNSSTLSFIVLPSATRFPQTVNSTSYLILDFDTPQTIRINYGDGTILTYNTFLSSPGVYRFRFGHSANAIETGAIAPRNFSNSNVRRNVFITFDKERLTGFQMYNIRLLANQSFIFPFSEYINLRVLTLETLTPFVSSLDFRNLENSQIVRLGLRLIFLSNSEFYSKIDPRVFVLPLTALSISGNYQNFSTSNASRIGTDLADTLTDLIFAVPITQASGLPSSFSNLVNLRRFAMFSITESFNLSSFPEVVNNWSELTTFEFFNNENTTMTSFSNNFTNNPKLVSINLSGNITNITNFTFIDQLQPLIKSLNFSGLGNTSIMTQLIIAIYNMTTNKADITGLTSSNYRNIRLYLETYIVYTAVIPTGVFQAPVGYVKGVSNGNPATDLERLYVLQNQYNYTITYRVT